MISPMIWSELQFLYHSILLGMGMGFLYDSMDSIRKVFSHTSFWVNVEDVSFWSIFCYYFFILQFGENNGSIRWFSIAGICMGMVLFRNTLGKPWKKIASLLLEKGKILCCKILRFLWKPVKIVVQKIKQGGRNTRSRIRSMVVPWKCRLTIWWKLFRIRLRKAFVVEKKKDKIYGKEKEKKIF